METFKIIGTIIKIGWRTIRVTALGTYIALAALTLAFLVVKYALGSGSKVSVQRKNLHMIRSTRKSMIKSVRAITR